MRRLFFIAALATATLVFAGTSLRKWEEARRQFDKTFKDRKATASDKRKAVKMLAELDDFRAVRHLLREAMDDDEFSVRRAAFRGIADKTTDVRAMGEVVKAAKGERSPEKRYVLARLAAGFAGKCPSVKRLLLGWVKDRDWRFRALCARYLGRYKEPDAVSKLEWLVKKDVNRRVRFLAARSLLACGRDEKTLPEDLRKEEDDSFLFMPAFLQTDSLAILIDASNDMDVEMALPKSDIIERLREMRKESEEAPKRRPRRPPRKGPQKPPTKEEKEARYRSNFVVSRIEYAKKKALALIKSLPQGVTVRVYMVSAGLRMSEAVKLGDERQMQKFETWLRKQDTKPGRDWLLAMKKVFADETVDTVLVIGCGAPHISEIDDPGEFISWLEEKNFSRGVRIFTAVLLADYAAAGLSRPQEIVRAQRVNAISDFFARFAKVGGGTRGMLDHVGKVPIPKVSVEPEKKPSDEEKPKEKPEEKPGKNSDAGKPEKESSGE